MAKGSRDRTSAQLDIIQQAVEEQEGPETFGYYTEGTSDNQGAREDFKYLFRRGRILVRDEHVPDVQRILGLGDVIQDDDTTDGLQAFAVEDVTQALETLEAEDLRILATPEHILYLVASPSCCPATEPEVVDTVEPVPPLEGDETLGKGVQVSVVDTGWYVDAATHPYTSKWLALVTGDPEQVDPNNIHPYAGHGTFIAGVIRCMAPSATVVVEGFLPSGGIVLERRIFKQVREALARDPQPDIISLSAGTPTRHNQHLLALERIWETEVERLGKTILVAAAGNDGSDRQFYPAALPWVYSVGSIDPDGVQSDFSNYGSWVDAYAVGRDLVNAFPVGTYVCHEPPNIPPDVTSAEVRVFENGLARWSGTSFSTPTVAGIIAARMSSTGETSREAADTLFGRAEALRTAGGVAVISPGAQNLV
jgi:subtilisin family serine protease